MIFFTSDTHFGQQRILDLSRRPFRSAIEMDTEIIHKWNTEINPDDTVYHLGDFGKIETAKHLSGKIKFVPGNYDTNEIDNISKYFEILDTNHVIKDLRLQLIHAPEEYENKGDNFILFGHIHKLQMVKNNALNVGVDCHEFYPINIDVVNFYKNAILNHYDKNVFDSIG